MLGISVFHCCLFLAVLLTHLASLDNVFLEQWVKVVQEDGLVCPVCQPVVLVSMFACLSPWLQGLKGIGAAMEARGCPQLLEDCVTLGRLCPGVQPLQAVLMEHNLN